MTGFNHGLTGAVIALTVKNPAAAVPLAFLSHFAQDAIPHHNYFANETEISHFSRKFNIALICDFLLSLVLMVLLAVMFPTHKWLIWGCMAAAAVPDLMWGYYFLYVEHINKQKPKFDPIARFHKFVEWSETKEGIWVEILWFVIMWVIIIKIR